MMSEINTLWHNTSMVLLMRSCSWAEDGGKDVQWKERKKRGGINGSDQYRADEGVPRVWGHLACPGSPTLAPCEMNPVVLIFRHSSRTATFGISAPTQPAQTFIAHNDALLKLLFTKIHNRTAPPLLQHSEGSLETQHDITPMHLSYWCECSQSNLRASLASHTMPLRLLQYIRRKARKETVDHVAGAVWCRSGAAVVSLRWSLLLLL